MPTRDDPPRRRVGTARRIILATIVVSVLAAAACTDQSLPTGTAAPSGPRAIPRAPNATDNPAVDRRVSAIQISAGYLSHVCALESDGQVVCWGASADVPLSRYVGPYTWVAGGGAGFAVPRHLQRLPARDDGARRHQRHLMSVPDQPDDLTHHSKHLDVRQPFCHIREVLPCADRQ